MGTQSLEVMEKVFSCFMDVATPTTEMKYSYFIDFVHPEKLVLHFSSSGIFIVRWYFRVLIYWLFTKFHFLFLPL